MNVPPTLDTDAFRAAWEEWIAYRRERRLPAYKPIGLNRQLARLAKWGPARAVAAIEFSICQNYQGIFEPTPGHGGPQRVRTRTGNYDGL